MNIHDLNLSISEMSEEQLMERIRHLRGERRKSDKPLRKSKKSAAKKTSAKKTPVKNLRTMTSAMTAQEKLDLLKLLES